VLSQESAGKRKGQKQRERDRGTWKEGREEEKDTILTKRTQLIVVNKGLSILER
jgi:hypothetical protein